MYTVGTQRLGPRAPSSVIPDSRGSYYKPYLHHAHVDEATPTILSLEIIIYTNVYVTTHANQFPGQQ
jgi:hypothetical protein